MWLFNLLPGGLETFIIYALFAAGVIALCIGMFSNFIPGVSQYAPILKIAGIISILIGTYLSGGKSAMEAYKEKIAKLEEQIKVSEEESKKANVRIDEVLKLKNKVITETKVVVTEKIKEYEKVIDGKCEITPEFIDVLNTAAKLKESKK